MSPAEYIYVEDMRMEAVERARMARERTLHRWVASGAVLYNITQNTYTVGCKNHAVTFQGYESFPEFPTERFIADMALAISAIPCRPIPDPRVEDHYPCAKVLA